MFVLKSIIAKRSRISSTFSWEEHYFTELLFHVEAALG